MAAPCLWKFDGIVTYHNNKNPLLITANQRADDFWVTIDGPGKVFLEFSFAPDGEFKPRELEAICKRKLRVRLSPFRRITLTGEWQRGTNI